MLKIKIDNSNLTLDEIADILREAADDIESDYYVGEQINLFDNRNQHVGHIQLIEDAE